MKTNWIAYHPAHAILIILSLITAFFGFYVIIQNFDSVGEVQITDIVRIVIGIILAGPGILTLYGVIRSKIEYIATGGFWLFLVYLFASLLSVTGIGFGSPFNWLLLIGCALIAGSVRLSLEVTK